MAKDVIADLEARFSTNLNQFKADMDAAAAAVKSDVAKMNVELAKHDKALQQNTKEVSAFSGGLSVLSKALAMAGGAVGIGMFIKHNLEMIDGLVDTADKIGITTTQLQEYQYVAEQSGVASETLASGFTKFAKSFGELKMSSGPLYDSLKKIDAAFLDQMKSAQSTGQALDKFIDYLAEMDDESKRLILSAAGFGKALGPDMVPLLMLGSDGLAQYKKEAHDLNLILGEEMARKAAAANDELDKLNKIMSAAGAIIVSEFAPALEVAARWWAEKIPEAAKAAKEGFKSVSEGVGDIVEKTRLWIVETLEFEKMFPFGDPEKMTSKVKTFTDKMQQELDNNKLTPQFDFSQWPQDVGYAWDDVQQTITDKKLKADLDKEGIATQFVDGVLYAWEGGQRQLDDKPLKPQVSLDDMKNELEQAEIQLQEFKTQWAEQIAIGAEVPEELVSKIKESEQRINDLKKAVDILDEDLEEPREYVIDTTESIENLEALQEEISDIDIQFEEFEDRWSRLTETMKNSKNVTKGVLSQDYYKDNPYLLKQFGEGVFIDPNTGLPLDWSLGGPGATSTKNMGMTNWDHFAQGTGLGGLPRTGPFIGHEGEIILPQAASDFLRKIVGGQSPAQMSSVTNNNNNQRSDKYEIIINTGIGSRPMMSATELADEVVNIINQRKVRFGVL